MVIMSLLIKPSEDVYDYYSGLKTSSSTDSGFDLIIPKDIVIPKNSLGFKIHLGIRCQPQFDDAVPRGFYLYPRSSLGFAIAFKWCLSVPMFLCAKHDAGCRSNEKR